MSDDAIPITVAYGDGVGPEVMDAALRVLRMCYANISIDVIEAGERLYRMGIRQGLYNQDIEGLGRTRILLLGPTVVPKGCVPVREALRARYGFDSSRAPHAHATAHYGPELALFECTQDAQAELAGEDKANPSGAIHAAALLLLYTGDGYNAARIQNAWLRTVEEGIHTQDMQDASTTSIVGTQEFADAVIERFGDLPQTVAPVEYTG